MPDRARAAIFALTLALAVSNPVPGAAAEPLSVEIVTDQADAVLALLAVRQADGTPTEAHWRRIFDSEGYRRLAAREASLGRPFTEEDFRAFALSDELAARRELLAATLEEWRSADFKAAARRALAYLPAGTRLRAAVYPVIKPRENSFVFDLADDPAIFLYLNPAMTAAQFENTVAHELHHVGLVACCRGPDELAEADGWPEPARRAVGWVGAFGEGVAMLAAAGGPDVHPHATSPAADRARWDGDVARAAENLREVEAFLLAILDGGLDETAERERAMSFFGVQGPWYTVGWVMASAIERAFGRDALLACLEDLRTLLPTYNRAAAELGRKGEELPVWSGELLAKMGPLPHH